MFKFVLLVTATLIPSYNTYNRPQTVTTKVGFESLADCIAAIATRQYEGFVDPDYELTIISCSREAEH